MIEKGLKGKIKHLIALNGPISISEYFSLCLFDPKFGYYRHNQPFGAKGDFVTAPDVSQLFGEMIGVFLIHAIENHKTPESIKLIEIGAGRGTMMLDILRVIAKIAPKIAAKLDVHIVEKSQKLISVQENTLGGKGFNVFWHNELDQVPAGFSMIVSNELFDALPLHQFVKTDQNFQERMVGLNENDDLFFTLGSGTFDPNYFDDLKAQLTQQPTGTVLEISPARDAMIGQIVARLKKHGGSSLIIDYGHTVSGFGDTLQAVHKHQFISPLENPGEADLTSHVDFQALAKTATGEGVHVHKLMFQGDFLVGLGILERAGSLGQTKNAQTQQAIQAAVERLAASGSGNMGELFKVMCISDKEINLLPFNSHS